MGANCLARWPVAALALVIMPLATSEYAEAACSPTSPVNNATVTCTGTTFNQNALVGYGSTGDTGNTINVQSGAFVLGTTGILGTDVTINNFGTISGLGETGIETDHTGVVFNSGSISAKTFGIFANTGSLNVTNSGTIFGDAGGISATSNAAIATVNNSGAISTGVGGVAISANTANVINSGTISTAAGGEAISANDANVFNSGTISANGNGIGIASTVSANVTNTGTISAIGGGTGITASINANIINSGVITGRTGIQSGNGVQFLVTSIANSGTISGEANGFGINSTSITNVTNTGTISGGTGIFAGHGSNIVNSGTIIGTGGTAIQLSNQADTLTLLPGSHVVGAIDMGGGADTVNVAAGGVAQLLTVNNFTGTINTSGPAVHTATQIATLDPTAFGQTDRNLMTFSDGVSSLVRGRLGGGIGGGVATMQAVGFAPETSNFRDRANAAFADVSPALGYGAERSRSMMGKTPAAPSYTPAPYVVWSSGFGSTGKQKADDLSLSSTTSAWAGAIGVDRQVRSDLLLGAFIGGGAGKLSVDQNAQDVNTDYVFGGVYGRFGWASYFFDFTIQGGGTQNKSARQVASNLAPGGIETASADYGGWYISPEVAYGVRYDLGGAYTLTPTARVRYLAGFVNGYSETGSAQNLVVGSRTLQDVEERGEVELTKITGISVGVVKVGLHGGMIALQRLGGTTIDTVLIGQNLAFAAPGKSNTIGAVAGAGVDLRAGAQVSLFGAIEGTVMSDNSRTASAKGGVRVAF